MEDGKWNVESGEQMSKSKRVVTIYSDGAARGNPGPAGAGALVLLGNKKVGQICEYLGETTNNVAEYSALILALESAASLKAERLKVCSDSELLVQQLQGVYKVKNPRLKSYIGRAKELLTFYERVDICHIEREKNTRADELANQAIEEYLGGKRKERRLKSIPEQESLF